MTKQSDLNKLYANRTLSRATATLYEEPEPPQPEGAALTLIDGRTMAVGGYTLTATGLLIADDATREDWELLGHMLTKVDAAFKWLLADWCASGDRVWGESYEQMAEVTGYEVKTLQNMASIARQVHYSRRREDLDFGHHECVAALAPQLQVDWLVYAANPRMSVAALRRALQGAVSGQSDVVVRFQGDARRWRKRFAEAEPVEREQIIRELEALLRELLQEAE